MKIRTYQLQMKYCFARFSLLILLAVALGCSTIEEQIVNITGYQENPYAKPAIGIMDFSNTVPAQSANLGNQLADQLTEKLIQTRRFKVVDRKNTRATLAAGAYQNNNTLAKQNVAITSPTQIRYLVKGTITDYGYIELPGWKDRLTELQLFYKGYAIVGVTLSVIDAQTGQNLSTKRIKGKVNCKREKVNLTNQKDQMGFGSNAFYYTVMGKATKKFLQKAINEITRSVEKPVYQPKIASIINDQVIINGGENHGVEMYRKYVVRPPSQRVLDPDTLLPLGYISGEQLGVLQITQVMKNYSVAKILQGQGELKPEQTLFPLETSFNDQFVPKTSLSHY